MIDWNNIDTVLLDMDGTLLDLNYDNHFWQEFVPHQYAQKNGYTVAEAKTLLAPQFKKMEGQLEWYCLDYWTEALQLDIVGMKIEIAGLIAVLPHVVEFLEAVQKSSRTLLLVTNAHRGSLGLKMDKTCLNRFFNALVSSHDFGVPKEQLKFWPLLQQHYPFNKQRTLMVDDSLAVLNAARQFGVAHLVGVSKPDTQKPVRLIEDYPAIEDFRALMVGL